MTNQTNEELLKKFQASLSWWIGRKLDKRGADIIITEFLSFIPQPEQLEVEIVALTKYTDDSKDNFFILFKNSSFECSDYFKTKQEALDFCKRFNLKVTNEEKE